MQKKNKKNILWKGTLNKFPIKNNNFFESNLWIEKLRKNKKLIEKNFIFYDYFIYPIILSELKIKKKLEILDFGGGLGELYIKLRRFTEKKFKFNLTVIENKIICKLANNIYKHVNNVKYFENLKYIKGKIFGIIHLGSSIQYVEMWEDLIKQICSYNPKYIIFSDTPLTKNKSFISNQIINKKNIVPYRFLNKNYLINCLKINNYELISMVPFKDPCHYSQKTLPMGNFKKENRIKNTSNLLFKKKSDI